MARAREAIAEGRLAAFTEDLQRRYAGASDPVDADQAC
jgi:hypothetical protein